MELKIGNDPATKMLCAMLGVKPEELQTSIMNLIAAGNFFKTGVDQILTNQREIMNALERIENASAIPAVASPALELGGPRVEPVTGAPGGGGDGRDAGSGAGGGT